MKELINDNNKYQIGIINKIGSTNIVDVDWIDNGSLVLYTQSPLLIDLGDKNKTILVNIASCFNCNKTVEMNECERQRTYSSEARVRVPKAREVNHKILSIYKYC